MRVRSGRERRKALAYFSRRLVLCAAYVLVNQAISCAGSSDTSDPLSGWVAMAGKAALEKESDGSAVLRWQFDYGKDPSVLTRTADASWGAMTGVFLDVKSDRAGTVFIRFDQKDKKIFLTHFEVGTDWTRVNLSTVDFQPFGTTTGTLDPAAIDRAFIVDLNGSDKKARGRRTVWIRNLSLEPQGAAPGALGGHAVPIVAYDADGLIMDVRSLRNLGTSAGQWCFVTDRGGSPLASKIFERDVKVDGKDHKLPVVVLESEEPATLEVLFWPAGKDFKVWLQADGRGKGIQQAVRNGLFLLNLELAHTRLAKLEEYLGGRADDRAKEIMAEVKAMLQKAEGQSSPGRQAALADEALQKLLKLSQEAVRQKAQATLSEQTRPGPPVAVPAPQGATLKGGARVTAQLVDPEFRIGCAQSFGFLTGRTSAERIDGYYRELRDAGFNHYVLPLFWDRMVDDKGRYSSTQWDERLRLATLAKLGFTLQAHSIIQYSLPAGVRDLKDDAFARAARAHLAEVADDYSKHFASSVVIWEAVNEPSSNEFGGLKAGKRVDLVSQLIGQLRSSVPGAKVMVNDYDWQRGLETDKPWPSRTIAGTLEFYKALLKKEHAPDVLGLEWYPGVRVERPEFKIDIAEPCLDLLDTSLYWDRLISLGKPLLISESNYPGSMTESDKNGYAWGRWNADAQALAAVDTLELALSKPDMIGWVWWSITDGEPWNRDGGLYTDAGARKPVLPALEALIASLKKPVSLTVDPEGALAMPRLPGVYRIAVEGGQSWEVKLDRNGRATLR